MTLEGLQKQPIAGRHVGGIEQYRHKFVIRGVFGADHAGGGFVQTGRHVDADVAAGNEGMEWLWPKARGGGKLDGANGQDALHANTVMTRTTFVKEKAPAATCLMNPRGFCPADVVDGHTTIERKRKEFAKEGLRKLLNLRREGHCMAPSAQHGRARPA